MHRFFFLKNIVAVSLVRLGPSPPSDPLAEALHINYYNRTINRISLIFFLVDIQYFSKNVHELIKGSFNKSWDSKISKIKSAHACLRNARASCAQIFSRNKVVISILVFINTCASNKFIFKTKHLKACANIIFMVSFVTN